MACSKKKRLLLQFSFISQPFLVTGILLFHQISKPSSGQAVSTSATNTTTTELQVHNLRVQQTTDFPGFIFFFKMLNYLNFCRDTTTYVTYI